MKKIINIFLLLCIALMVNAQELDRSIRPSAAPAKAVEIKDAQNFVLSNGLKVFVVEDHRAPVIYYGLDLDIYPALEGTKTGLQDMFTSVIGTATKSRSKEQLNRETDLIGASISSSNRGGHARALKKYESQMLELFADILLNPVFLQSELDLNLEKERSGLKMLSDDAGSINGRVSTALTHGKGYPAGELTTEATLNNINVTDLEQFHNTYFAPNVARLVIVGDITLKEAKANAEKYFGKWSKKNVPVAKYTIPAAPATTKVAYIEKTGAVQSSIDMSYPVTFRTGAPDEVAAKVMSYIFGGGMSSRLLQSLRETHSYTYGVYGILSSGDLTGRYYLTSGRGAGQVKATATDSAIYFIREEMTNMINTPIKEQELKDAKAYMAGSFGRSLESPETIAQFAVNIDKYKLPKDYYRTYLQRLDAVTVADVQAAAKKYLKPENAWIVVTGDKQHAEGLKRFAGDRNVQFYDMNANPVAAPETKTVDLSPANIIEKYVDALGGKTAIEKINDYKITAEISAMGQQMEMTSAFRKPNHTLTTIGMNGMVLQKIIFDGTTVKMSGMQGNQEFTEGDEFESIKAEAALCPDMNYAQNGYTLTVKGIEKINGKDTYALEVAKNKSVTINYYDVTTGLKVKSVTTMDTPQGPMQQISEMSDYRTVEGIQFPHAIKQSAGGMVMDITTKSIEINTGLADEMFK